jgi:hypothetical protein
MSNKRKALSYHNPLPKPIDTPQVYDIHAMFPQAIEAFETATKDQRDLKKSRKKTIDSKLLMQLAAEDCTADEIGAVFGVHADHIYSYFKKELDAGREIGKVSLKRKMFASAMNGNVAMLIWLSKQKLGYKDRQPEEATQIHFHVKVNELPVEATEVVINQPVDKFNPRQIARAIEGDE